MQMPTISRVIAGGAGLLAAIAALALMLSDINPTNPSAWRLDHGLMPVVLVLTIASGHFVMATARAWRAVACAGWLIVAIVGSVVTLYNSLGRQNDTADRQIKQAEDINRQRGDVTKQMIATGTLLNAAMLAQATRCERNPDSDSCRGSRSNVRAFATAIEHNQQQLREIGPEQTAAPKATVLAATVALFFTVDEQLLRKRIMALEPFLYTVLFEIGSIVAFSFALSGTAAKTAVAAGTVPQNATVPQNSGTVPHLEPEVLRAIPQVPTAPSSRPTRNRPGATEAQAKLAIVRFHVIENQQFLADHFRVSKSTVSRWVDKWEIEGIVTREPDGRCNVVGTRSCAA